ncbi:MAG: hypothetical protein JW927_09875 [Deltaproteobacteria bacterium]|nr:hypothetical protein [Deltaproteobacteria bacterium]
MTFIDDSRLFAKEYFFQNDERKYSYHWTSFSGELIFRWDNAPHWENLKTFPHHKHTPIDIIESRETTLEEVLKLINKILSSKKI